jgi:hypothetical protein
MIHEALGHSAAYRKAEDLLDVRMYGGVGAVLGFFVTAVLLKYVLEDAWYTDQQLLSYSAGGAVVGNFLGRLALHVQRRVF